MKTLIAAFGANERQAETYLRLLSLGAQPISAMARQMGTPRSTMYLMMEDLKKLQLVEHFRRDGITYVKATQPKNLLNILLAEEKRLEEMKKNLKKNLPTLETLENKFTITPHVRFFEGKKGISQIYEQVLYEKKFIAYFNPALVKKFMPQYHFKIPESIRDQGKRAKELLVAGKAALEYQRKFHSPYHQIKMLPKGIVFPSDMIITEEKVYMISYSEREVSGTELTSPSIAKTHQEMFSMLWKNV